VLRCVLGNTSVRADGRVGVHRRAPWSWTGGGLRGGGGGGVGAM